MKKGAEKGPAELGQLDCPWSAGSRAGSAWEDAASDELHPSHPYEVPLERHWEEHSFGLLLKFSFSCRKTRLQAERSRFPP